MPGNIIGSNSPKLDDQATNGLLGVNNSAAYRIHEIEKHLHSKEVWYGRHSAPSAGVNEGEAWSQTAFVSTSGLAGVFGAWIPLLGTSDTPFKTGYAKFDPHRITIMDTDASKKPHLIQFAWGLVDAATAYSDGDYTGFWSAPEKDGKVAALNVHFPRIAAGKKLWERHLILGDNSKDIDFYFGLHEYIG